MKAPIRAALALPFILVACASTPEPVVLPEDGEAAIFTGAGDIGVCGSTTDDSTAALLDRIPGVIWTTGDNAYPAGSRRDFVECYHPSWGRHLERTRPTPGNHEYWTPGASGYFDYFGERAGERGRGWYSYRYGGWLVVALNSNLPMDTWSEQSVWLRKLLVDNPSRCAVAYFHHPLVSSGSHGSNDDDDDVVNVRPIWNALYRAGVDIVLVGHDHHYERFAPMTPGATADPENGIRQFIVGTGGGALRGHGREPHPLSEVFLTEDHGVLKLYLGSGWYAWEFLGVDGRVHDSGRESCH